MRWLVCTLLAVSVTAWAADFPSVEPYRLAPSDSPPTLDGDLSDPVWNHAPVINEFHQIRPVDHGSPSEPTEVRVAYDEEHFYIGVRLMDSDPQAITAKGLIQGQPFFSDDRFEVRLDTFNDRRNSYFFQVNANAIRRDALAGNDYWIEEWDTIWFAEAALQDWGWSAEIAIPFKSISFDPATDTWGLNFSRVIPRKAEETPWSSLERRINPNVSGYATGMRGMEQGRGIEVAASATVQYLDTVDSGVNFEPSLTGFYRFTPFLTGALTLNTDFAATEVDSRQVNLSRFNLFFPEKRDFFLQDASIFEFGNIGVNGRPFFSRTIGLGADGNPLDLHAGVKLTGRAGDWNIGALAVHQDPAVIDGSENLFVGRASRNILGESSVGMVLTSGDPASPLDNRVAGFDINYRDSDVLEGQTVTGGAWAQQSSTEGINGDDAAFGARWAFPNDRVNGYVEWSRIEENFFPALGFVNRRGVDILDSSWRYRHRMDDGFLQWVGSRVQFFRAERIGGSLQSQSAYLNVIEGTTSGNDFFTIFVGEERENVPKSFPIFGDVDVAPGDYAFGRYGFYAETGEQRDLSGSMEVVDGDFFGGRNLSVSPSITWRPSRHLRLSADYFVNKIQFPDAEFSTRLYRLRADIAFNARWAWLTFIQGDNFSDTVGINSRLRWQPQPDREFFLVLNQLRDADSQEVLDTEIALKATINLRL